MHLIFETKYSYQLSNIIGHRSFRSFSWSCWGKTEVHWSHVNQLEERTTPWRITPIFTFFYNEKIPSWSCAIKLDNFVCSFFFLSFHIVIQVNTKKKNIETLLQNTLSADIFFCCNIFGLSSSLVSNTSSFFSYFFICCLRSVNHFCEQTTCTKVWVPLDLPAVWGECFPV